MSDESNVIDLRGQPAIEARIPSTPVIEQCKKMLEMALSGELQGVCTGLLYFDGSGGSMFAGRSTLSLIGSLEEAKHRLLTEREET